MRNVLSIPLAVLATTALLTIAGCPADTPGTGAPDDSKDLTQLTAFLPEAVSIDVDELPEDADSETAQVSRNQYQQVTRSAGSIVHRFQRLADRALALGAAIRDDMTSADQTQVFGSFTVRGQEVAYKCDFAAFDFDGDGTADGSGNAVDLPVAMRLWVDRGDGYERFLCALIAEKPSTDSFGEGQFYVYPYAASLSEAWENAQMYVNYDRTGDTHRWNEAICVGRIHPQHVLEVGVARVDRREAEGGGVSKTVRSTMQLNDSLYTLNELETAVHYARGGTVMLGSARASNGERISIDYTDVCVDLVTLTVAEDGACDELDTQDMDFLDMPTAADAAFPEAFPATPTF